MHLAHNNNTKTQDTWLVLVKTTTIENKTQSFTRGSFKRLVSLSVPRSLANTARIKSVNGKLTRKPTTTAVH